MARKCRHKKKSGARCDADVQTGKSVCVFHDPSRLEDGRRARRAGGITRSRTASVLPPETPINPLGDCAAVAELLAQSINQVLRGQLDVRVARTAAYMASVHLTALAQGPTQERLARIEAALGISDNAHPSSTPKEVKGNAQHPQPN